MNTGSDSKDRHIREEDLVNQDEDFESQHEDREDDEDEEEDESLEGLNIDKGK